MNERARLLMDPAHSGAWNMAVDEALLDASIKNPSRGITLRWYRWKEPTLSLGYFQSAKDAPEELRALPLVRRLTGGGAIVHDQEVTYSLIVPPGHWPRVEFLDIVRDFHQAIAEALCLAMAGSADAHSHEPYLCFERRSPLDLVKGESKIVGSAQRKRSGALLQHGSILLGTSRHTPRLRGLAELGERAIEEQLAERINDRLARIWNKEWRMDSLTDQEQRSAQYLKETKYGTETWTRKR